jgi:hypothetical protein
MTSARDVDLTNVSTTQQEIIGGPSESEKDIFLSDMSVVYYKFKAAKDEDFDVYTFDGTGTSVFDLKREIIRAKKLGKGTDFDLAIYNSQSNEGKENRDSSSTHNL